MATKRTAGGGGGGGGHGHSARVMRFWRRWVRAAGRFETPFFLFGSEPFEEALEELGSVLGGVTSLGVRHWYSFKTQPLPSMLEWWRRRGGGVEVVSAFELRGALAAGFEPSSILVNGPAKAGWLKEYGVAGLKVNFDSLGEVRALAGVAKRLGWGVGLRVQTRVEVGLGPMKVGAQFGLDAGEVGKAVALLRGQRLGVETVHFHLRTNVPEVGWYAEAIRDVAELCKANGLAPRHLDCGGGYPPPHTLGMEGERFDAGFGWGELAGCYGRVAALMPSVRELWLENGRYLSARTGVLVVTVLEVKEREGRRWLICDGGRTTNALVSNWESHGLWPEPTRSGRRVATVVCGPTCMAFDQLSSRGMASDIRVGDRLVWMDAGAYHLPWETRFSHGWSRVLWVDGGRLAEVRSGESFEHWWGMWGGGDLGGGGRRG